MVDGDRLDNVMIRDNGLRSFVPPTFCYELYDRQSRLQVVVSDVVIRIESKDWTLERVIAEQCETHGFVESYELKPASATIAKGLRFVITAIEGK
jgi:hypothetical protein